MKTILVLVALLAAAACGGDPQRCDSNTPCPSGQACHYTAKIDPLTGTVYMDGLCGAP